MHTRRNILRNLHKLFSGSSLSCAYYLASEGKVLCHVEQWPAQNLHPYKNKLPGQRVSELFGRISPSQQQDFFSRWVDLNYNGGYFAIDVTSVSSYSELIDFVRRGYNWDGDDIVQINVLMTTSESTHIPVLTAYFLAASRMFRHCGKASGTSSC